MATGSNPSFGSSQSANGSEERSILLDMSRKSDQPCDVTLVVKDGKEIKACGNVLKEVSSFFKGILDGDWNESGEGIIRLEFATEEVMKDILELIYSGSVHVSSMESAEDLIAAADFLLLPSHLKDIPGQFCEQTLSNYNCISIYHYAERYRCEKLLAKTTEFIHFNFPRVANAEEFLNLSSHEVEQWISSDDINISAEDDVFRIILKWIDHDKNERKKKFHDLFRHVRLSFVSPDCYLNEVSTNEFVKHDDTCTLPSKTPRNVFQTEALVVPVMGKHGRALIYVPDDDEWYLLPRGMCSSNDCPRLLSFKNKLFFFYSDFFIVYDPFLNYWTELRTWTNTAGVKQEFRADMVSVVGDACLFVGPLNHQEKHLQALYQIKLDSGSWEMISLLDLGPKRGVCFVFADKFLYAIGGVSTGLHFFAEAARFDTIEKKWEKIADIQEARCSACGVSVGDSIFIAGGNDSVIHPLQTCEMYNILTNEWHFIANLTIPRSSATMVCVDGMPYVLGGASFSTVFKVVECYDKEKNEWKQKTTVPLSNRNYGVVSLEKACSLRILKGILSNLQSLQQPVAMQRQCTEPISDSFAAPVENVLQRQPISYSFAAPGQNVLQRQGSESEEKCNCSRCSLM